MAKKKKSQLKPVVRGFATVSQAKKVVPAEVEQEKELSTPAGDQLSVEALNTPPLAVPRGISDDSDPEQAAMQSLQNLIDTYQDRVEKEILRTLKVCAGLVSIFTSSHLLYRSLSKNAVLQQHCPGLT